MKWPLRSVTEWQRLRLIARGNNEPVPGKLLRLDKSRSSQDGTFLDALVERGLLEVAAPGDPNPPKRPGRAEPVQYRATYRLTAMGLAAADTGEYAVPEPHPIPVRGPNDPAPVAPQAKPAKRGR